MDTHRTTAQDELQLKQIRYARRIAEDEMRRTQPCACCGQPLGPTADYVPNPMGVNADESPTYLHFDCRRCEICEEVIVGDYVEIDVKQQLAPTFSGRVAVYSEPRLLARVYYHAACAHHAGLTPTTRGAVNPQYGFATRDAGHDCIKVVIEA